MTDLNHVKISFGLKRLATEILRKFDSTCWKDQCFNISEKAYVQFRRKSKDNVFDFSFKETVCLNMA